MSSETILEVKDLQKTFRIGFFRTAHRGRAQRELRDQTRRSVRLRRPERRGQDHLDQDDAALDFPDRGSVAIFGKPNNDPSARQRLGYLPENPYIYSYLRRSSSWICGVD